MPMSFMHVLDKKFEISPMNLVLDHIRYYLDGFYSAVNPKDKVQ